MACKGAADEKSEFKAEYCNSKPSTAPRATFLCCALYYQISLQSSPKMNRKTIIDSVVFGLCSLAPGISIPVYSEISTKGGENTLQFYTH